MLDSIAVIPARGGSKRIPRKNIRNFAGVPLVGWSIRIARQSNLFSRVVVSSEDPEICDVARQLGAEVPFVRPNSLADDETPTISVIRHAIHELDKRGLVADMYCCIFPTSPLMRAETLACAVQKLREFPECYVFPAAAYAYPPQRGFTIGPDGKAIPLNRDMYFQRTQDLPRVYHDVGQFFMGNRQTWLNHDVFHDPGVPIEIDANFAQDIDTLEDWTLAEELFRKVLGGAHEN